MRKFDVIAKLDSKARLHSFVLCFQNAYFFKNQPTNNSTY